MIQEIISINGGRRQHWAELRTAYALIREVTYRHKIARNAPTCTGQKLGAWDDFAKAIDALQYNPVAMRIHDAQGRDLRDL